MCQKVTKYVRNYTHCSMAGEVNCHGPQEGGDDVRTATSLPFAMGEAQHSHCTRENPAFVMRGLPQTTQSLSSTKAHRPTHHPEGLKWGAAGVGTGTHGFTNSAQICLFQPLGSTLFCDTCLDRVQIFHPRGEDLGYVTSPCVSSTALRP